MSSDDKSVKNKLLHLFFEGCVLFSIVGIWPRFIEPKLLSKTKLQFDLKLKKPIKVLQLSDLHLNGKMGDRFLEKLIRKVKEESPDMIFWVGDFLCNGRCEDPERLLKVLKGVRAPLGVFAVLGNHDYEKGIIVNDAGDYDLQEEAFVSPFLKGIKRLFTSSFVSGRILEKVHKIKPQSELLALFEEADVTLLDNKTVQVAGVNVTGIGEYMGGKADLNKAFSGYDKELPGIVLAHNPDAIPQLLDRPGALILCGHTHGGQINIPLLWKKFTLMEHMEYKSGYFERGDKKDVKVCFLLTYHLMT